MMTFKIGPVSSDSIHLFTDIIEIALLTGYARNNYITKNDVESLLTQSDKSDEEIDDDIKEEIESDTDASTKHNKLEQKIDDAWTMLEYRSKAFSRFYPFSIQSESIEIIENFQKNDYFRIYLILLLCSRLKSFSNKNGIHQHWAAAFTIVCKYAFLGLVPNYASVKIFDANSTDRKAYYSTHLHKALIKLGEDMNVKTDKDNIEQESTSGDLGLDLVGIVNFDDGEFNGNYVMMGQCGAQGESWPKKTLESHSDRYRPIFQSYTPWQPIMFTPVHYRNANGTWVKKTSASGILLIDRLRITQLLCSSYNVKNVLMQTKVLEFLKDFSKIRTELLSP